MLMGTLRSVMVPELKTYQDLAKPGTKPEFYAVVDQKSKAQLYKYHCTHNKGVTSL